MKYYVYFGVNGVSQSPRSGIMQFDTLAQAHAFIRETIEYDNPPGSTHLFREFKLIHGVDLNLQFKGQG